ncbi:MAG: dihydroorotase [Planctomycetes bacterium]|nr:dihydroorotase [Planctomycetota bacterium]
MADLHPILIRHGRVIDPANKLDAVADVLIVNGKVIAVGKVSENELKPHKQSLSGLEMFDARGLWIMPGLVDLRAHLGEPGNEGAETIAGGALSAIHGGFTTVACMPDTDPALDSEAAALYVRRQSDQAGYADVYPVCALTKKREGKELAELGQLAEAGAVAFSDEQRATDSPATLLRGMAYASMFDRAVIEYAQDPALAGGAMNAGYECTLAGLPGIPAVAEELAVARACMFARESGAHFHAANVTTTNAVRAIKRARKMGVRVSAETSPHYLCLTDAQVRKNYDTNYKVFPPLRTAADIGWLKRGLREGAIDCIASGHQPVAPEAKELEFGRAPFGIVGLETALALTMRALDGELDLPRIVAAMTINPARVLRLDKRKGHLSPGADGDVCMYDPKYKWTIDPAMFVSRCKNTPFAGMELVGKPRYTIARGRMFDLSMMEPAKV